MIHLYKVIFEKDGPNNIECNTNVVSNNPSSAIEIVKETNDELKRVKNVEEVEKVHFIDDKVIEERQVSNYLGSGNNNSIE